MKNKKINILSKRLFDHLMDKNFIYPLNVHEQKESCFISIINSKSVPEIFQDKSYFDNCKSTNVLLLKFDDLSEEEYNLCLQSDYEKFKHLILFSDEHAKSIIEFIKKHEHCEQFILHCSAGISRSGAVGTFINDYFHQDYFEFRKNNPNIQPNSYILQKLNSIWQNIDMS